MKINIVSYIFRKVSSNKALARICVVFLCRLHSFAYKQLGFFACNAEPNSLHPKHRLTKYHEFFVDNVLGGDRVLDIGCGNGALSFDLAKKAKIVIGIDVNKANIEYAQKNFKKENLLFMVGDITKKKFSEFFDAVVLSNVLEHVKDRDKLLRSLTKITNKILIRVPQYDRSWEVLYKHELGLDYRLDSTHEVEYTHKLLERELKHAGLILTEVQTIFGEFRVICTIRRPR